MNRTLWLQTAAVLACLLAALVTASAHPTPAAAHPFGLPSELPTDIVKSISVNGFTRSFVYAVSASAAPSLGRPLVIYLHGDGSDMGLSVAWKNAVLSDANGAVLLSARGRNATPGCPLECGSAWRFRMNESGQPYDDVDFIDALITRATTDDTLLGTHIYPYQVYVVGESRGAGFAYFLYADPRTSNKVRAIVPLSGTFYCEGGATNPGTPGTPALPGSDTTCGEVDPYGWWGPKPSLFTVPNVRHAAHILDVHGQLPPDGTEDWSTPPPALDTDWGATTWAGWGNAAGCYTVQVSSQTGQTLGSVGGLTVKSYAYSRAESDLGTRCALDLTFYIVQGGGHVPAAFEPVAWSYLSHVDHPANTLGPSLAATLASQASLADTAAGGAINLPIILR